MHAVEASAIILIFKTDLLSIIYLSIYLPRYGTNTHIYVFQIFELFLIYIYHFLYYMKIIKACTITAKID